jgi:hypothetical protein
VGVGVVSCRVVVVVVVVVGSGEFTNSIVPVNFFSIFTSGLSGSFALSLISCLFCSIGSECEGLSSHR